MPNDDIPVLGTYLGSRIVGIESEIKTKSRKLYEFSPGGDKVDGLPPGPSIRFEKTYFLL